MRRTRTFAGVAALLTMLAGAAMAGTASAPARSGGASRAIAQELSALYRTQESSGALTFAGSREFYQHHPIMATMVMHAHRESPGAAFLSQSAAAIARYYQFLFTSHDRNGNLLVETVIRDVDGTAVTVEDIGFNSLLALDLMSLAELYVELRKPARALYWYEGARTLQGRIVAAGFDPDATYFFPVDTHQGGRLRGYYALSALPVLFDLEVGSNHAAAIASHYVTGNGGAGPEKISSFVTSPDFPAAGTPQGAAATGAKLLKTMALVEVLRAARMEAAARDAVTAAVASLDLSGVGARGAAHLTAYHQFLAAILRDGSTSLFPRGTALNIVRALAQLKRVLPDNVLVRSVADTRAIVDATAGVEAADADEVELAMRSSYVVVSGTRDAMRKGNFVTREDAYEMSGVPVEPALERLLEDATDVIRSAENELFLARLSSAGLVVSAGLGRDRTVIGRDAQMRWSLVPHNAPVRVGWLEVRMPGSVDTLVTGEGPLTIAPGKPVTFMTVMRPRGGVVSTLNRVNATLVAKVDGRRLRWHTINTVYLEHAVDVRVTFPHGRVLDNKAVPLDVRVIRRVREDMTIRTRWYSPSGLRLREGEDTEFTMGVDQDTVTVRYNVVVPKPCRPGTFPFKMGFSQGTDDLGVVSAHMYRPFHWLYAGPFAASPGAMSMALEPERNVNLYAEYDGATGRIGWQQIAPGAHLGDGTVSLRSVMAGEAIGYLYTVVQSNAAVEVPARLRSNVPASLFINGKRVIANASLSGREPAYERVFLREGLNEILVKVHGNEDATVYFNLGDESAMAPDEFSNDLWELIDSFQRFVDHTQSGDDGIAAHRTVTLRYVDAAANSVSVIGSFNGWSPEHTRMQQVSGDTWEITLSLAPGRYTYRLLVNNRKQILDPDAGETEADGYGGRNSVLVITSE